MDYLPMVASTLYPEQSEGYSMHLSIAWGLNPRLLNFIECMFAILNDVKELSPFSPRKISSIFGVITITKFLHLIIFT
jgi:hypothetical protein